MARDSVLIQPSPPRDLDPNVRQRTASDPGSSVWVSASAGTGKTKVLTDRVLRLLLPRADGTPGTLPHKILCLTFTKAGAGEMALRINKKLGAWAVAGQEDLAEELSKLLGRAASDDDIAAARKLFTAVVDVPGGLKIMTIHSFCQSVLGRFPLEAKLSPHFEVLEEAQAAQILMQARDRVLSRAEREAGSPLQNALYAIAGQVNEQQFLQLIQEIVKERHQLSRLFEKNWNADGLYQSLCGALDVSPNRAAADILREACADDAFDGAGLRMACDILSGGTEKTDQPKAVILQNWLAQSPEERVQHFEDYKLAFFTTEGSPRKTLTTKNTEGAQDIMAAELDRLCAVQEQIARVRCAALTRDIFTLGHAIADEYETLKQAQGVLDFDDLIIRTLTLLDDRVGGKPMSNWVHYKLDDGLDHILIDEAQDTNPEQWQIIAALCEDFFSGENARSNIARTVFSVGDEKQSIYSFQRAAPEEFERMKRFFAERVTAARQRFEPVPLNISFRSTQCVLDVVDAVFAATLNAEHHSYRRGQAGLVELWPLFENEKPEKRDPWDPPIEEVSSKSAAAALAEHIGDSIQNWIDRQEKLPSHDRPIRPGDIMILLRTRTGFTAQLMRALKSRNIPVSGVDRMVLGDQLVIEDMLALAEFALLPGDDLTLACILKSPIFDWTEEQLYDLAIDRDGTLWDALPDGPERRYLSILISKARSIRPFEFFSLILQKDCPADDQSGLRAIKKRLGEDAVDPLDEFLNAALDFEKDNIPSLQQFVHWQKQQDRQIKRELEDAGDKVRIMTVHGAKGLQAPIVILPDTTGVNRNTPGQAGQRLLWPEKSELSVPLWSPRKDTDCDLYKEGFDKVQARLDAEYQRLLYVAMTRAEDRLYVGGYTKASKIPDQCWYSKISGAMESMPGVERDGDISRLTGQQTKDPDRESDHHTPDEAASSLPEWLFAKAPSEPYPPAPLVPSRPSEAEPPARSPFQPSDSNRFRRGNITHKLLQFLPDIAPENRSTAATNFVSNHAKDLDEDVRKGIVSETMAILDHPEYAPFFAPGSMAEVPISGLMPDDRLVSGQIDRLVVRDDEIWIIDYKSNRPPPADEKDIPQIYQGQMQAYRDTLIQIYPNRTIHCALLWTDGPRLMVLDLSST